MMEHAGTHREPTASAFWQKAQIRCISSSTQGQFKVRNTTDLVFFDKKIAGHSRRVFDRSLPAPSLTDHTVCIIHGILFQRLFWPNMRFFMMEKTPHKLWPSHRVFLEHWNSQKSVCNIRQRFSCLLKVDWKNMQKKIISRWLF